MQHGIADAGPALVEGVARVISIEGDRVCLEPEQSGGCGACAASAACDAKGIGTLASRLEARRFSLPNELALTVGDRVVLGVRPHSLVRASAIAYLIPLFTSLGAATLAQWHTGSDAICMVAAIAGLALGFLPLGRVGAWLERDGDRGFRILRLAAADKTCAQGG